MNGRANGERKAGASGWLGLAAVLGALAGLTLFPRKAHGQADGKAHGKVDGLGRPVTRPEPHTTPAGPQG